MLIPLVGILRKSGTLNSHDTEALTGGRLHHHPALQAVHDSGTQLFKAAHLGGDVVGLDVDVDAALVLHALNLHDGLVGRGFQHEVVAPASRVLAVYRAAQCLAPEAGGLIKVTGPAVDQHGAEAGGGTTSLGLLVSPYPACNNPAETRPPIAAVT